MSVRDRVRDLDNDLDELRVLPAADVRARGRRRARRRTAATTAAVVVVVAAGGVVATRVMGTTPGDVQTAADNPAACDLTVPDDPSKIRIRVSEDAATTAAELRSRRFSVVTGPVDDSKGMGAALTFGPKGVGAAHVVVSELHGDLRSDLLVFDAGRTDATVDLSIGPGFMGLATTAEFNEHLTAVRSRGVPWECTGTMPSGSPTR